MHRAGTWTSKIHDVTAQNKPYTDVGGRLTGISAEFDVTERSTTCQRGQRLSTGHYYLGNRVPIRLYYTRIRESGTCSLMRCYNPCTSLSLDKSINLSNRACILRNVYCLLKNVTFKTPSHDPGLFLYTHR